MAKPANFDDERTRYGSTPDRYSEVARDSSFRRLFERRASEWRDGGVVNYVDLGCGSCRGTRLFADYLASCTGMPIKPLGVDTSSECEADAKMRGIDYMKLDLGSKPLPLRDIQVFTLFETIEHVFDTDFLLESIRRSIADDGVLLVSTLNVVCWKNRVLVPLGIQPFNTEVSTKKLSYGYRFGALKRRMDTWSPAGHIRPFTLYSLCDILVGSGFEIEATYGLENWRAFKFLERIGKNLCTGILVVARPS